MSTTFPRAKRSVVGYNVEQVEDFLEEARRAYGAPEGAPVVVTAESIRHTAFAMQRGGFVTAQVDAALERLEDAFAARERDRAKAVVGEEGWTRQARATAQVILDRLSRPRGQRFDRAGRFALGYDRNEVDDFADRIARVFQDREELTAGEIRRVEFASKRGGYREQQVDLVLDGAVGALIAVQ